MKNKKPFLIGYFVSLGIFVILLFFSNKMYLKNEGYGKFDRVKNKVKNENGKKIYQVNASEINKIELAKKLRDRGDLDKAIKILKVSLQKYPDNILALNLLGEIYTIEGYYEEAQEVLNKSLNIKPETWGFRAIGVLYRKMGRYKEAKEFLSKAIDTSHNALNKAWAFFELAELYKELKKLKKAEDFYKRAIKLLPEEKYFKEKLNSLRE